MWPMIWWILWIVLLILGFIGGVRKNELNSWTFGGSLVVWLMLGLLAWLSIGIPK